MTEDIKKIFSTSMRLRFHLRFLQITKRKDKLLNGMKIMASNQEDMDVFDSWEQMDETEVLERKLKEILPRTSSKQIDTKSCSNPPVNVILLGDDALRSQYVPPEPTVKILKRPSKDSKMMNGDSKPRQQFKTLKQREQEYAEARLRILGEAHSSEKEEKISGIHKNTNNVQQGMGGEPSSVVRLPRGPDGTKGFNVRR